MMTIKMNSPTLIYTPDHFRINPTVAVSRARKVQFTGKQADAKSTLSQDAFQKKEAAPGTPGMGTGPEKPGVTIWGGGNLGHAILADLIFQNQNAKLPIDTRLVIPRQSERAKTQQDTLKEAGYINLNDMLTNRSTRIPIESRQIFGVWEADKLADALKHSQTVFITLPDLPSARKAVLKTLLSADLTDKTIILAPGGEGGVLKAARLLSKRQAKGVTIGLLETGPYGARIKGTELASKRKSIVKVAAFPEKNTQKLLQDLDRLFPLQKDNGQKAIQFKPVSPIEIMLSGQNYIYHVAVALDSGNIARGHEYVHYLEGITPKVAERMEALDRERILIGKAFGLQLEPLNEALNNHYGIGLHPRYYDAFQACRGIYKSRMPAPDKLAHHRYVLEDLPGISVIERLGEIAGVPTPVTSQFRKEATENALRIGTQPHEIQGYRKALAALPGTIGQLNRYLKDPASWLRNKEVSHLKQSNDSKWESFLNIFRRMYRLVLDKMVKLKCFLGGKGR